MSNKKQSIPAKGYKRHFVTQEDLDTNPLWAHKKLSVGQEVHVPVDKAVVNKCCDPIPDCGSHQGECGECIGNVWVPCP